jgi:hypothetical protein
LFGPHTTTVGAVRGDDFPLPCIDQLVDATAGCECMSFIDAYSGYHQVWMVREDKSKHFSHPKPKFLFIPKNP